MFMISSEVSRVFNVDLIESYDMDKALKLWNDVSVGKPPWLNPDDGINTINFAKFIADTRGKLTTLDIGIAASGSARADYLQTVIDSLLQRLPEKICEADRLGGLMIKFNGKSWDYILPGEFGVTAKNGDGDIVGAIFATHTSQAGSSYTRLEYHRFENGTYAITNKAFRNTTTSQNITALGTPVPLDTVEAWAGIQEDVYIANIDKPLFAYFRIPGANTIDKYSPLGMSIFSNAITELKALDIAISRKDAEIEDSKHVTFVGQTVIRTLENKGLRLPRFVRGMGVGIDDSGNSSITEHVATLLTDSRIKDINFNLSLIGVKCGFSPGMFVLDGQKGAVTATQVEADDRDTIQTIKTDRDALQAAIEQAIYGADVMATLYDVAPMGEYELAFSFGDITYNYEEDKAMWRSYAVQGWIPKWLYLVKFEKMTEEEAKAVIAEAEAANMQLELFQQQASSQSRGGD